MTQEKEVQTKDVNGGEAEVKDKGTVSYTMDELAQALENDPEIRSQFMKDEEQFLKDHVKDTDTKDEPEKKEEDNKEDKDDLPEEVQVTVKKDWLSTYAKNRSPEDAIHEMSKGNAEKDKTIDFFKTEKIPKLEKELGEVKSNEAGLKKQIEDYKQRLEAGKKEDKKTVVPEFDVLDVTDEDLLLSDEGQAKFKKSYTGMAQALKALVQKVEGLENPPENKEVEAPQEPVEDKKDLSDAYRQEYTDIDTFVSQKKDVFGSLPPMELMETNFLDFMSNLAKTTGIEGPIQEESGRFVPKLQTALKTYLDKEEGQKLRNAMQEQRIPLLDESQYNSLSSIYGIRQIKSEYKVPYDVALEIYNARNRPSEEELKLQGNIEGHQRYAKAVSNRENQVKETPSSAAGGDAEILKMPVQEFQAIMGKNKNEWSDREKHIVKTVHLQQGIDEKEFKRLYGY